MCHLLHSHKLPPASCKPQQSAQMDVDDNGPGGTNIGDALVACLCSECSNFLNEFWPGASCNGDDGLINGGDEGDDGLINGGGDLPTTTTQTALVLVPEETTSDELKASTKNVTDSLGDGASAEVVVESTQSVEISDDDLSAEQKEKLLNAYREVACADLTADQCVAKQNLQRLRGRALATAPQSTQQLLHSENNLYAKSRRILFSRHRTLSW